MMASPCRLASAAACCGPDWAFGFEPYFPFTEPPGENIVRTSVPSWLIPAHTRKSCRIAADQR